MTGGFPSIMRPYQCWTILHTSILAGLLLTIHAKNVSVTSTTQTGVNSDCSTEIIVRRNTVHKALLRQQFRINCTVIFCNVSPPTVTWHKVEETAVPVNVSSDSHIKTEWKLLKDLEGVFYLIFQNILRSDSGQYQCRSGGSVSHAINVTVIGDGKLPTVTQINATTSTTAAPGFTEDFLLYVYCAAGIATFVIIVIIISFISMWGCKGKPKKETHTENQYMEIPMVEQHFPHASLEPSQRGSPSAPPSRRSTKRKTPSRQPNELTLSRNNEQAYGQNQEGRGRQRNTVEEDYNSVVYAALNHELPQPPPRPRRQVEETSEYAAIRVA